MHRRPRQDYAPVLSSLFRVELGHELPEKLSWRGELASLTRLELAKQGLRPTTFSGPTSDYRSSHHCHVSRIDASPDGALLSVAASNSRLELHELGDESESLRLTLHPRSHLPSFRTLRLSAVAWVAPGGAESIVMGFENHGEAYLFDLQTCRASRPTQKIRLQSMKQAMNSGAQVAATDVVAIDNNCFAACLTSGEVKLFDLRASQSKNATGIATFNLNWRDVVIDVQGMYLYAAADKGAINMFDRRMTHVETRSLTVKSFGGTDSCLKKQPVVAKQCIGKADDCRVSYLKALPRAAPGCLVYQTSNGSIGYVDLADPTSSGEHIREDSMKIASQRKNETGLDDYGTTEVAMHRSWTRKRPQFDVIVGQRGRGWKVVAPFVTRTGLRIVSFAPGMKTRGVRTLKGKDCTCVHAPSATMDKFVIGCGDYSVEVVESNFGRQDEGMKTEDSVQHING